MKNLNKLYISLILLSTSVFGADKSYAFIGIQTGSAMIKNDVTPTFGLKYGMQTRKYRTALSYNYAKTSKNSYQTLMMQMDTGVLTSLFRNSIVRPYMGLDLGVIQENNLASSSLSDRGYIYGADVGLAYVFNDTLDFDIAYHYLQTAKLKNLSSLSDLSLSMHYFY